MTNLAMLRDIGSHIKATTAVKGAVRAAGTFNGPGIDRTQGASNQMVQSLVLMGQVGATTGTPTSFTVDVKIQHSDDDGATDAYADLDLSAAIAQLTAIDTEAEVNINLHQLGAKKWVRAVMDVAFVGGTSPDAETSATFVLGGGTDNPL